MKKKIDIMTILALAIALTACSTTDEPQLPNEITPPEVIEEYEETGSGETDGYTLVWEDLFNESSLNNDKWKIEVNGNGNGNNELEYYAEENISMGKEPVTGKNCLIITARKQRIGNNPATSGRLNTSGKKEFTFGKIEASIKLPKTANGLWPAFWLLGADYSTVSWPACGEIDILEMGHINGISSGKTETYFNGACHWGYYLSTGGYPNYARSSNAPYSLQDDFHLYTLIWDKEAIKMYLDLDKNPDVQPYYEMNISDHSTDTSPGKYFQKDFFIILNLAVGGNFTGIWDINKVTALSEDDARMYVDYVKLYQK